MSSPKVTVLQTGKLRQADNGAIIEAHSSVVLVSARHHLIVIDSGCSEDRPQIEQALKSIGVEPEDVTLLINSHSHCDHVGCNHIFTKARIIIHAAELDIGLRYPSAQTSLVTAALRVDHQVLVFPTPGHTSGSLSVLVKNANTTFGAIGETVVIAGDAIPLQANYLKCVPPALYWNRSESCRSMVRILAAADWVIPGHDHPFRVRHD